MRVGHYLFQRSSVELPVFRTLISSERERRETCQPLLPTQFLVKTLEVLVLERQLNMVSDDLPIDIVQAYRNIGAISSAHCLVSLSC